MRLAGLLILFFPLVCFGQEVSPQVGKHVAANMDVASIIISLLLVLLLIIGCAFVLRKFQPNASNLSGMKVISSLHLGPKERLVVVQVNKEQLLLGVTGHNISVLKVLEEPIEVGQALGADLSQSFLKLLKKSS
jgi:flagellar protein FliO/FliZ